LEYGTDGFNFIGGSPTSAPGHQSVNSSSYNYVAWNWKANGSGSANTVGTINSTVSVNTDAGFSIVSYTGNGTNGAYVGHGLSKAPEMVMIKNRSASDDWRVGFSMFANDLELNDYTAAAAYEPGRIGDLLSTKFELGGTGSYDSTNVSGENYIAYCWHSVDGYSKVGSYSGNANADGTFVYTGFKPMWVMVKRTTSNHDWDIYDTKRSTFNPMDDRLRANDSVAEGDGGDIDFTSNGFKLRQTGNGNGSGTYIYICFAETPFKYSNAR
jgi:hypothetical protein